MTFHDVRLWSQLENLSVIEMKSVEGPSLSCV